MFGDLDWPINVSRRFVSIRWASCYFQVRVRFGCWQNLGSGSVRSCWVRFLSHL